MKLRFATAMAGIGLAIAGCGGGETKTVTASQPPATPTPPPVSVPSVPTTPPTGPVTPTTPTDATTPATSTGTSGTPLDPQALIAQVRPSVISITGRLGEDYSGGSGVIFDLQEGLAFTNEHVVAGLTAIKGRVNDASTVPIQVVGQAPCDDVAVVKLGNIPTDATAMPLGSSSTGQNGQHVTALGYPASFENPDLQKVVTTDGRISSPDVAAEPDQSLPKYPHLIQHNADINPGNSGGPLVDDSGNLLGLNTLGNTEQGGRTIQGQYYAIAIDHIKTLMQDLIAGKDRDYVGWSILPAQYLPTKELFRLTKNVDHGLIVLGSDAGSAASTAGFGYGDLVETIDGTPVNSVGEVCDILQSKGPGDSMRVTGEELAGDTVETFAVEVKLTS
jgi:S1-C subfamily serine protease